MTGPGRRSSRSRARDYYARDRACPLAYEPSGEDFFSPCLEEADLMRRVLPAAEFSTWLSAFLPGLAAGRPFPLSPAVVSDPTDPRLVHLDGLNLTRAWTLSAVARALPASDARRKVLENVRRDHAEAGLARVSSGSYEGEHWLASFAVYLLTDAGAWPWHRLADWRTGRLGDADLRNLQGIPERRTVLAH